MIEGMRAMADMTVNIVTIVPFLLFLPLIMIGRNASIMKIIIVINTASLFIFINFTYPFSL